ncbi:sigma-70 family RNA polymerase sigma factor [Streptomyces qinzhouensis]|uniref:RNA polymerase sigma factor 70 region 4 type 2 domain-containing protein n=1 Tax=Streptomyces qinzhouensis TaxID=2599401 RepID=A0A5B8JA69_9ACTN|nr:sigma-70 family RNA polymerase sigma factor [Streptomyces qinzhouensis]QDY78226.1 hypothetical protein FQU76_18940 [Streptomyces qinzhouensis]
MKKGRRTRPWGPAKGAGPQQNRAADVLRSWLDQEGLTVSALHARLAKGRGPVQSRATVSDRLAGLNLTADFVDAVAAACFPADKAPSHARYGRWVLGGGDPAAFSTAGTPGPPPTAAGKGRGTDPPSDPRLSADHAQLRLNVVELGRRLSAMIKDTAALTAERDDLRRRCEVLARALSASESAVRALKERETDKPGRGPGETRTPGLPGPVGVPGPKAAASDDPGPGSPWCAASGQVPDTASAHGAPRADAAEAVPGATVSDASSGAVSPHGAAVASGAHRTPGVPTARATGTPSGAMTSRTVEAAPGAPTAGAVEAVTPVPPQGGAPAPGMPVARTPEAVTGTPVTRRTEAARLDPPPAYEAFLAFNAPRYTAYARLHLPQGRAEAAVAAAFDDILDSWTGFLGHPEPAALAWQVLRRRVGEQARAVSDGHLLRQAMRDARDSLGAMTSTIGLFAAISELPEHQFDVIVLRYVMGCLPTEVAALLGVHEHIVRSRARHAKARLAKTLALRDADPPAW